MRFLLIFFIGIFISIYGVINYYIGVRGWQYFGTFLPFINSSSYWIAFSFISAAYLIAMLLTNYLPAFITNFFLSIGGYWLVIMLYLLLLLPVIDILQLLNRRFTLISFNTYGKVNISFLLASIVLLCMLSMMLYGTWSGKSIEVNRYNITLNKKAESLKSMKVIMVSDIHLGSVVDNRRLTKMVDRINELEADIILIAGDIIDNKLEPFVKQGMGENFKRLKSKYGVYACLGNHDAMAKPLEEVIRQFSETGIIVVRDKAVLVGESFYIIGRDDNSIYRGSKDNRKPLSQILEGIDKTKPLLLVDHEPRNLDETEKAGIDVQFSGHTHRGQFIPINLITSRIYEVDFGHIKKRNLDVIVSSGFGTWGPPIRIGSRSEIVEIMINYLQ